MADKRDEDEGNENYYSSFMYRNFPDARPLQQNKLATDSEKVKQPVRKRIAGALDTEDADLPPLRIPGNSEINADDYLRYQGNGVQNRVLRQLKQGKITVEDRLDLHGQTIEQAHRSTMIFINRCQQQKKYCVLIIHGRGYRSAGGIPLLKQNVFHWLQNHDSVLAFHSAVPADGGKGAVYALLRKNS